jgi:tetratricopeptide (TPR) repeat protein
MKLKQALLVLMLALCAGAVSAQDKAKCESTFRIFEDNIKAGSVDEAAAMLNGLIKNCPRVSNDLYIEGEKILKQKLETRQSQEAKEALISDLVTLYSEHEKNFPKNTNGSDVKKAILLREYQRATDDEVFKMLDASFKLNRANFTDYNALETYFLLYLKQFEAGNKSITQEQFIEKYGELSSQVLFAKNTIAEKKAALLKKQETSELTPEEKQYITGSNASTSSLNAVSENINILASKHFSCDKFDAYYEKNYEARKGEASWLEALVNILYSNKCYTSAVLQKGALALHAAAPSSQSAFMLGSLSQRANKTKEAISYFEKSAELEAAPDKKADIYYKIASLFRNTDKAEAKKYALKAAETNPKFGRPYIFLAEMYASVSKECSISEFERKAVIWLAIETLKKADIAEPKYKPTVASMMERYTKKIPTKDEISAAKKKKGDKITLGCWINESVTIPKTK